MNFPNSGFEIINCLCYSRLAKLKGISTDRPTEPLPKDEPGGGGGASVSAPNTPAHSAAGGKTSGKATPSPAPADKAKRRASKAPAPVAQLPIAMSAEEEEENERWIDYRGEIDVFDR